MTDVEPGKAKAAGIVGIFIGSTALVNIICGCIYAGYGGPDGSGLWSGFGLLITAILGIVTWVKHSRGTFIGFLVLSILLLISSIVQVPVALIVWLIWHVIGEVVKAKCSMDAVSNLCVCTDEKTPIPVNDCDDISIIVDCIIAIVISSSLAVILTFAGSIIGCTGVCCMKPQNTVVVVQQPGMVMTQQTSNEPPPKY